MTSILPLDAAEDALLVLLKADGIISMADKIELGSPPTFARSHVFISDDATIDEGQGTTAGNAASREQDLEIRIVVFVAKATADFVAVRNVAHELAKAVSDLIRANRTLSGTVFDCEVVRYERQSGPFPDGRAVLVTITLKVTALPA